MQHLKEFARPFNPLMPKDIICVNFFLFFCTSSVNGPCLNVWGLNFTGVVHDGFRNNFMLNFDKMRGLGDVARINAVKPSVTRIFISFVELNRRSL